jgi:hypothetical protein
MHILFFLIILFHGLVHLMGFAKAFHYAALEQLTQEIPRPMGLLWLLCTLLLALSGGLFLFEQDSWWWLALPSVLLSQVLIFTSWGDARFGTIANLIILLPLIAAILDSRPDSYGNGYKAAVREYLVRQLELPLVTEADLSPLPAPVQKYLRFTGAVGKPRILNFRAVFTGTFRNGLKSSWMSFRSEQYNFFDPPTRLFLMKASMFGLPVAGLHLYRNGQATMQIKMASLWQVADARGPQMNQGETVTLFNDLCVLAPAALIDRQRIQWEEAGPTSARARFTHNGITVSAQLSFNAAGELIDFISNDRFLSTDGKRYQIYPWSTPVGRYKAIDGRKVVSYGETVWHTSEGEFIYGKFNLAEIEYNLRELK